MKTRIYECMKLLGATSELLCIIGSWGDTLSDEDVRKELDVWIANQEGTWEDWNWNKQLVSLLLNPQDNKAEEFLISLEDTPVLFEQLQKMSNNFFGKYR